MFPIFERDCPRDLAKSILPKYQSAIVTTRPHVSGWTHDSTVVAWSCMRPITDECMFRWIDCVFSHGHRGKDSQLRWRILQRFHWMRQRRPYEESRRRREERRRKTTRTMGQTNTMIIYHRFFPSDQTGPNRPLHTSITQATQHLPRAIAARFFDHAHINSVM
jgi:hypothetical protein